MAGQNGYPIEVIIAKYTGFLFVTLIAVLPLHALSEPHEADLDADGLPDDLEQTLAEKFAPIVFHENNEPNLPTNVDVFLTHTALLYHDENCSPPLDEQIVIPKTQRDLLNHSHPPTCGSSGGTVSSSGTLSDDKRTTFYLKDLEQSQRIGSVDSTQWTTYFHCYPTADSGFVVKYWRFYAFNTGKTVRDIAAEHFSNLWSKLPRWVQSIIGSPMAGFHGGDWEGVQVVLDKGQTPSEIWFLGHTAIEKLKWESVSKEGTHPKILAEFGGHSSSPFIGADESHFIHQECWTGGKVTGNRAGFQFSKTGSLINVGEKTAPLNGQDFIQYSGLWGSPSQTKDIGTVPFLPPQIQTDIDMLSAALYPYNSGYWGPAYNETEKRLSDDFITAWGHDMKNAVKEVNGIKENYPQSRLPR